MKKIKLLPIILLFCLLLSSLGLPALAPGGYSTRRTLTPRLTPPR